MNTGIALTFQGFDYVISNRTELKWLLSDMTNDNVAFYLTEKNKIEVIGSPFSGEQSEIVALFPRFEREVLGNGV